jgi:stage V sporulation protein D (sporulation-specific penicillin-binding protein)
MREALYTVVEIGTGTFAKIEGYNIGGKTGTAEMVQNGKRLEDQWVGSFISAAPIENPDLLVYVVVDRSNDEEWYSSSKPAQDLSKAIWEKLLPYYNIHSNLDEYDYLIPEETSETVIDSFEGSYIESSVDEEDTADSEEADETENAEGTEVPAETAAAEETQASEATPTSEETQAQQESQLPEESETAASEESQATEAPQATEPQASEESQAQTEEVPADNAEVPAET